MAYGLMPSQAATCPDAKHTYINGHFCYADKFAIRTNGLALVRHISFIDDADFKAAHPDTFLGDSAFDSADLYGKLFHDFHFSKVLIPYNPRNESSLKKVGYNAYGYPTCPKIHYHHGWVCGCDKPCSSAKKVRTTYTYENMDLRMFPGIQRDTKEWNDTYKIRAIVERAINHFKINICISGKKQEIIPPQNQMSFLQASPAS